MNHRRRICAEEKRVPFRQPAGDESRGENVSFAKFEFLKHSRSNPALNQDGGSTCSRVDSMNEFPISSSPLCEGPLGFYEGDPYRAKADTGLSSGRGHLRDGRFQTKGDMAPQVTYLNRFIKRFSPAFAHLNISNVKRNLIQFSHGSQNCDHTDSGIQKPLV